MKIRLCSLFLSLATVLSLTGVPVSAAGGSPAVSSNIGKQNYATWASPVTSYLMENEAGGLTLVEYINGQITVEDYASDFSFRSGRTIPMELSIWGGFFAGADYNFFVFGQKNPGENDRTEVIRVVKYSKDWQRLDQASLYGANTVIPFEAGSLRMDEYGGYLYIRTCHEMYASSDGLNHQSNLTLAVRQSDMSITDSCYDVMNINYGYVSHSFNQFILVDQDGKIIALDHGDAYPRSAVLTGYYSNASTGKFSGGQYGKWCWNMDLETFAGSTGNNTTGASVGGLAETANGYVMTFNYDGVGGRGDRYIYFQYMDKATGKGRQYKLNNSAGSTTPVLAPTGLDGGYLLWNETGGDTLHYVAYDDSGVPGETVHTASAPLSDCQPIPYGDGVVWYTTDNSTPVFYTLDSSGVTAHSTTGSAPQPETPEQTVQPQQTPQSQETPQQTPQPQQTPSAGVERMYAPPTLGSMEAVDTDGNLWVWGTDAVYLGYHDQVDEFDRPYQSFPVKTSYGDCLAAGDTWFVKKDHSLWIWGLRGNITGDIADDEVVSQPVKVMDDVLYCDGVADNRGALIALKTDGTLWGWGDRGNLAAIPLMGFNNVSSSTPVKLMDNVKEARSSQWGWMALKTDGTLWACGYSNSANLDAQAYTGDATSLTCIMDDVAAFDLAWQNTLVIKTDGSLWAWGENSCGQVGNGGSCNYPSGSSAHIQTEPVKVLDNVVYVSAGYTSYAVTADGTLWGWGSNSSNQLGFTGGNFTSLDDIWPTPCQSTPVPIATDVYAAGPSDLSCTYVLKNDGSLWALDAAQPEQMADPGTNQQASLVKLLDNVAKPVYTPVSQPQPSQPSEPSQPSQSSGSFSDVSASHWAYADIRRAAQAGWINGVGGGRFSPSSTLSNAQFYTLLGRVFYPEETQAIQAVHPGADWWYPPCAAAFQNGVLDGTTVGNAIKNAAGNWDTRRMTPAISRQDMAQAIANLMKDRGFTVTAAQKAAAQAKIGDWSSIPAAYRDAVSSVYALGIITGTSQGTFAPNQSMTRAEAAAVLCRLADALAVAG